jgi:NitT/TauT family transport system substrate-binding protein
MNSKQAWLALTAVLFSVLACAPAAPARSTPTPSAPRAAAAAGQPAAQAPTVAPPRELVKVRWGGQSVLTDSGAYIALDRGYFQEEGIDFEYVNFASASDVVPALANNQLEVGALSCNVATLNALGRGTGIKLVADRGILRPGFGWIALVVRPDLIESGRFRTPADLRGLQVAVTPPLGATSNAVAIARLLEREGIAEDDVQFTPLPFPDMNPALANGAVDAAFHSEPLMSTALRQGIAVRIIGSDEIYPNQQLGIVGYGGGFIREQPEAARRFMVAYLRGLRDFVDAFSQNRDRAAVVQALIRHTPVKDPAVYDQMTPTGFNPDGYMNVESMAADQEWFLAQGRLPQRVDLGTVVDHQYVDYALSRLGRYQP